MSFLTTNPATMLGAAEATFSEAFELLVLGMGIVFVALTLIMILLLLLQRLPNPSAAAAAAGTGTAVPASPEASTGTPEAHVDQAVEPEIYAIIASAIAVTIRQPSQIRRISFVREAHPGWAARGRTHIHSSHAPRKRS